ncbi:MAG: hypothetical protein R3F65_15130 [bacterium]
MPSIHSRRVAAGSGTDGSWRSDQRVKARKTNEVRRKNAMAFWRVTPKIARRAM